MNDEFIKNFDMWNVVKKDIYSKNIPVDLYFLEKEVWWASLGLNIGEEINGKHDNFERPILILKKISENTLWVLPITSTELIGKYYYTIKHHNKIRTVCLLQIRFISAKRLLKFMYAIDNSDYISIKEQLCKLLDIKGNSPL